MSYTQPSTLVDARVLLSCPPSCKSSSAVAEAEAIGVASSSMNKLRSSLPNDASSNLQVKKISRIFSPSRFNPVHHKPRCSILCCPFRNFNGRVHMDMHMKILHNLSSPPNYFQRFGFRNSQFIHWFYSHHHKLYGLVTNQPRPHSANNDHVTNLEGETLYKELPGNKGKVKLHCVIVVVSFIFFGLIPPLFYGLSFKRTDKELYKAAVVLAASLVCIISLSFAKAYAFGIKKRWTVPIYTGMAIGASAFSFIANQFSWRSA